MRQTPDKHKPVNTILAKDGITIPVLIPLLTLVLSLAKNNILYFTSGMPISSKAFIMALLIPSASSLETSFKAIKERVGSNSNGSTNKI